MRFIARVSVLAAATLMTVGVAAAGAAQPSSFSFTAEKGAWPVSDKSATWDIVDVHEYNDVIKIDTETPGGWDYIRVELGAGKGARLTTGTYENVRNLYNQPDGPGIQVISGSFGCGDDYATFTITDLERTDSGTLTRFSADIEQHCGDPAGPALRATVHYES